MTKMQSYSKNEFDIYSNEQIAKKRLYKNEEEP